MAAYLGVVAILLALARLLMGRPPNYAIFVGPALLWLVMPLVQHAMERRARAHQLRTGVVDCMIAPSGGTRRQRWASPSGRRARTRSIRVDLRRSRSSRRLVAGSRVAVIDTAAGQIQLAALPDDLRRLDLMIRAAER